MKIEKRFEKGHKKTVITTNIKEIKEFLKCLKKNYHTQASYQIFEDRIEYKLNGHINIKEGVK
jgi:hypothetical protein